MKYLRPFLLFGLLVIAFSWFSYTVADVRTGSIHYPVSKGAPALTVKTTEKLEQKVPAARQFVHQKNFNGKYCFLIDMSIPSGKDRFFIYDLQKDSIVNQGLVAHGNCFEYWLEGRKYSNVVGSGCTSLGKYKIGIPYTGKFGYSYKLHGLDSSNNNAFERTVVLHSHSCIPEKEVTDEICQSNGCPTVSPVFLQQLKTIVNTSRKPVLLWIYD
jgi:hypothetical protein